MSNESNSSKLKIILSIDNVEFKILFVFEGKSFLSYSIYNELSFILIQ